MTVVHQAQYHTELIQVVIKVLQGKMVVVLITLDHLHLAVAVAVAVAVLTPLVTLQMTQANNSLNSQQVK